MEINVTDVKEITYAFLGFRAQALVATVEFPEHDTTMTISHREDDPDGMWLADSRISAGAVHFSHGEADRTCNKQIAGEPIVRAIRQYIITNLPTPAAPWYKG